MVLVAWACLFPGLSGNKVNTFRQLLFLDLKHVGDTVPSYYCTRCNGKNKNIWFAFLRNVKVTSFCFLGKVREYTHESIVSKLISLSLTMCD